MGVGDAAEASVTAGVATGVDTGDSAAVVGVGEAVCRGTGVGYGVAVGNGVAVG